MSHKRSKVIDVDDYYGQVNDVDAYIAQFEDLDHEVEEIGKREFSRSGSFPGPSITASGSGSRVSQSQGSVQTKGQGHKVPLSAAEKERQEIRDARLRHLQQHEQRGFSQPLPMRDNSAVVSQKRRHGGTPDFPSTSQRSLKPSQNAILQSRLNPTVAPSTSSSVPPSKRRKTEEDEIEIVHDSTRGARTSSKKSQKIPNRGLVQSASAPPPRRREPSEEIEILETLPKRSLPVNPAPMLSSRSWTQPSKPSKASPITTPTRSGPSSGRQTPLGTGASSTNSTKSSNRTKQPAEDTGIISLDSSGDEAKIPFKIGPPRKRTKSSTSSPVKSSRSAVPPKLPTPPVQGTDLLKDEDLMDDDEDPNNWTPPAIDLNDYDMRSIKSTGSPESWTRQATEPQESDQRQNEYMPSEDEYDSDELDHPGMDINDENAWNPIPERPKLASINTPSDGMQVVEDKDTNDEEAQVEKSLKSLTISPRIQLPVRLNTSRWYPSPPKRVPGPPVYIWDQLRMAENVRFPRRPRSLLVDFPRRMSYRSPQLDFDLHRLKPKHSFKTAPGAINTIAQQGKYTAIASSCSGGLADESNEILDAYNYPGSLLVYSDVLDSPRGHELCKTAGKSGCPGTFHLKQHLWDSVRWVECPVVKYYSVLDVKFDPHSEEPSFASCGMDKKVRLWTQDADSNRWSIDQTVFLKYVPHSLAFHPEARVLAIAEKDISILKQDDSEEDSTSLLSRIPIYETTRHSAYVGSMAWGFGPSQHRLFASSEPPRGRSDGVHKAFDPELGEVLSTFNCNEAGDALTLDQKGSILALCTQAEANKHMLRVFDAQRLDPKPIATIRLTPFEERHPDENFEGEVNVATFSPDGIYLALARSDNHTHVYDRRMLERGPIFDYHHFGTDKTASRKNVYGIVQAQWIQSSSKTRMVLVTGGEDGCVRTWDPLKAATDPENGKILAEVTSDISYFSLGDPYAGEHRLVVGDAAGVISIFDNLVV